MLTKDEILVALRKTRGKYISGEKLAKEQGISRTAVWKHIEMLRKEGYEIISSSRSGYLLKSAPDLMLPSEIRSGLQTKNFGKEIHYFEEIDSTNNKAKALAFAGAPEGTLVIAEEQLGGRGRLGRSWFSPPGGIWFSLILRPGIAPRELLEVTLLAGVVCVETITETTGMEPKIKWPNDLLIDHKKLAGVLTEMETEADKVHFVILGVGLNANINAADFPPKLAGTSTSLSMMLGRNVDRHQILRNLLMRLESGYTQLASGGFSSVRNSWIKYSETLGSQVRVETVHGTVEGRAINISSEGALILELSTGETKTVWSGDVIILR